MVGGQTWTDTAGLQHNHERIHIRGRPNYQKVMHCDSHRRSLKYKHCVITHPGSGIGEIYVHVGRELNNLHSNDLIYILTLHTVLRTYVM